MKEVLVELSHSDKPWASNRAAMALKMSGQFEGGGLDEWEYQDMMLRLIDDNALDKEADDLDTKALLITAIHQVSGIV